MVFFVYILYKMSEIKNAQNLTVKAESLFSNRAKSLKKEEFQK